jgi:hypothetical protein
MNFSTDDLREVVCCVATIEVSSSSVIVSEKFGTNKSTKNASGIRNLMLPHS